MTYIATSLIAYVSQQSTQLSVLLVGSQQGVYTYITAILLPYKVAVSMWKIKYNIWTTRMQAHGL